MGGCNGATKLQTLEKLQNRAARIVTESKFDTPAMELNWPTVSDIIRSETAIAISTMPLYICTKVSFGTIRIS